MHTKKEYSTHRPAFCAGHAKKQTKKSGGFATPIKTERGHDLFSNPVPPTPVRGSFNTSIRTLSLLLSYKQSVPYSIWQIDLSVGMTTGAWTRSTRPRSSTPDQISPSLPLAARQPLPWRLPGRSSSISVIRLLLSSCPIFHLSAWWTDEPCATDFWGNGTSHLCTTDAPELHATHSSM